MREVPSHVELHELSDLRELAEDLSIIERCAKKMEKGTGADPYGGHSGSSLQLLFFFFFGNLLV